MYILVLVTMLLGSDRVTQQPNVKFQEFNTRESCIEASQAIDQAFWDMFKTTLYFTRCIHN